MIQADPCPFCGMSDIVVLDSDYGYPICHCKNCKSDGPPSEELETADDAIAKWNIRAFTRSVLEKFVAETYAANQHLDTAQRAPK